MRIIQWAKAALAGRTSEKEQQRKGSRNMEERKEERIAERETPVEAAPTEPVVEPPAPEPEEKPEAAEAIPASVGEGWGEAPEEEEASEGETETVTEEEKAWATVAARLEGVEGRLAGAESELKGRIDALQKAVSGLYTQTTDAMHRELEKHRKGLVRKLEQELFGELIEIYDAAERGIERAAGDPESALEALKGIREQVDAALFNRGVEKREAVLGEAFDGRKHHATSPAVPTGDVALDGRVAVMVKAGFDDVDERFQDLRGGCMRLRPIWVRVHKYDPSLAVPVETAPAESEDAPMPAVDGETAEGPSPRPSMEEA